MKAQNYGSRMEAQQPTLSEIDALLGYMSELLKDPKLNERRRLLILGSIDDLLDVRKSHSSLKNLNYVASPL